MRAHLRPSGTDAGLTRKEIAEFWANVDERDLSKCWEWQGGRSSEGYGYMTVGGKTERAHRIMHVIHHGYNIPPGMFICHTCDNPPCVNPLHIYLGNAATNAEDAKERGRVRSGEDHPTALLTNAQAREIRDGYDYSLEYRKAMAEAHGVSVGVIDGVVHGKTYRCAGGSGT